MEAVCELLTRSKVRLITLMGPPGVGKTRLGIQVAGNSSVSDYFGDGVFLVELAPVTDPGLVEASIAKALGLAESFGQQSLETALLQYIQAKRMLLVVDNFEQVLDAAPQVVKLIEASPWIKVLVTSREALHVRGERQYPVAPLQLPVLAHSPDFSALSGNPALQLFMQRARSALPLFELTTENIEDVVAICTRLDGLPLAIELAAARTNMLSLQQMREGLVSRLKLPTRVTRDLPARQRTLRGAIEWSYNLLGHDEQGLFRQLGVFTGGFTARSAEAVCNAFEEFNIDALEGLITLVDKSLLQQREGSDGKPRFWMLETIHEYAREKLEETGEVQGLRKEYALYFMRLVEEAEPHLTGKRQQEWLERLEEEYDNIRAVLALATGSKGWQWGSLEPAKGEWNEIGMRIAGAILRFWLIRGLLTEGRELVGAALSMSEVLLQDHSTSSRAKALNGAGILARRQGDYSSARALLEEALALGRAAGDKQSIALSLNNLGHLDIEQGDPTGARALYEESLALRREIGDKSGIAASLGGLGGVAHMQGDYVEARALQEESLTLERELGDKWSIAFRLTNLGVVVQEQGDYVKARILYEESLALRREIGDKGGVASSLGLMALVAYGQHNLAEASALYKESLAMFREMGDRLYIAGCLAGLGGVAVGLGVEMGAQIGVEVGTRQVERGARLLGTAEGLVQSMGAVLDREDLLPFERGALQARAALGEEAFERVWQEGQAMSMEQAIEYACQTSEWLTSEEGGMEAGLGDLMIRS